MAARKRSAVKPGTMPQEWRDRIKASMLINRLTEHANGSVEMTSTQVTAALGLLKKAVPDLAAVQISGDPSGPLVVEIIKHEIAQ
jgi:hypothetical protein